MTAPRVSVVHVTYNSAESIGASLDALRTAAEAGWAEVIIVDNLSRDGTVDMVRERWPWARVIETGANLGFGRGCNAGLDAAQGEHTLFLNPDAVLDPKGLERLCDFLDDNPKAGLIAPAIVEGEGEDEELQTAGGLPSPALLVRHSFGLGGAPSGRREIEPGADAFQTDWLCGAALMGRTQTLCELGAFDPRFFLYFEETDLCRRVAAAGLELWAVGAAVARHEGGASAKAAEQPLFGGCIAEHYFASRYYYLRKHHGLAWAFAAEGAELLGLGARALVRGFTGRPGRTLNARLKAPLFSTPPRPRMAST